MKVIEKNKTIYIVQVMYGKTIYWRKLNNMNCENMIKMMEIMQEQVRKKETEAQFLKDKQRKNRNL